jgi:transposase
MLDSTHRAPSTGGDRKRGAKDQALGIGPTAVIPSNRIRKVIIPHDAGIYKLRNRIERCFCRLKHFRRFVTRYDRRVIHFTGFTYLVAAMIWPS